MPTSTLVEIVRVIDLLEEFRPHPIDLICSEDNHPRLLDEEDCAFYFAWFPPGRKGDCYLLGFNHAQNPSSGRLWILPNHQVAHKFYEEKSVLTLNIDYRAKPRFKGYSAVYVAALLCGIERPSYEDCVPNPLFNIAHHSPS